MKHFPAKKNNERNHKYCEKGISFLPPFKSKFILVSFSDLNIYPGWAPSVVTGEGPLLGPSTLKIFIRITSRLSPALMLDSSTTENLFSLLTDLISFPDSYLLMRFINGMIIREISQGSRKNQQFKYYTQKSPV